MFIFNIPFNKNYFFQSLTLVNFYLIPYQIKFYFFYPLFLPNYSNYFNLDIQNHHHYYCSIPIVNFILAHIMVKVSLNFTDNILIIIDYLVDIDYLTIYLINYVAKFIQIIILIMPLLNFLITIYEIYVDVYFIYFVGFVNLIISLSKIVIKNIYLLML